ncbi:4-alpha-glucanotransferase [Synechococcales cyanobacterium C]|uniref:4-alpha-glucanotransferase n=1 Tax=Petrachloros mirabilis ULC683 TaxID=2781853 RepID=A0A8K2A907_9CYAN|nr:4-alpha-glucanotransferase [Petrachloros mirabilis]NCJ07475.1 4-alpha-glucanotransferase [Petrachloros mirabilis ULC683]
MPFPRASGLLLHPTSLPGRFGIGDLGQAAYQFVDFMAESGQQLWQVLPLGPTSFGHSPYMCYSAMAGNPLLLSLEHFQEQDLLGEADLQIGVGFRPEVVAYEQMMSIKWSLLRKAARQFLAQDSEDDQQAFDEFCQTRAHWLNDYALFMALKDAHGGAGWNYWDGAIAKRDPTALDIWQQKLMDDIALHKVWQFQFFQQWSNLRQYANDHGIQIIGDIPIYVAHNSADVWANPEQFHLDPITGEAALMAGVPPDYFSDTGQLWGNPIYNWAHMQNDGFQWWLHRFRTMLEYVDLIRVDHFRGFRAYWQVKQGETTAMNGEWVNAPGDELFETIRQEFGSLPILAEDLGVITPDVEALRDKFEFPGMKILHFAFGSGPDNPYLPYNLSANCLVYTGTHDNNTTVGWFHSLSEGERQIVEAYIGGLSAEGIHWDLIRLALSTVANQVIIPVQDLLGLDSAARMNLPSTTGGNWSWRYPPTALTTAIANRLRHLTELYGRGPAH